MRGCVCRSGAVIVDFVAGVGGCVAVVVDVEVGRPVDVKGGVGVDVRV